MPIQSIPEEIRQEWESIYERIKEAHPDWSDEKVAKVTWGVIKKRYHKDPKTGRWVLNRGVAGSIGEGAGAFTALYLAKIAALEDHFMQSRSPAAHELLIAAKSVEILNDPPFEYDLSPVLLASNIPLPPSDADYMYLKARLLHAEPYVNANGMRFPLADLEWALKSGQFSPQKPVIADINHRSDPIVGFVLGAELVDADAPDGSGKTKALDVYEVVLAWLYPDLVERLKSEYKAGRLGKSMACVSKKIECAECGQTFSGPGAFRSHVCSVADPQMIIHEPVFRASSFILRPETPADAGATTLEVTAMDNLNSYTEEERKKLQQEQKQRAKKYGIAPKEGGNLTKPKEYESVPDDQFLDPVNYRYPIDEAHLMPALRYFNHEGQREKGGYTKEEWAKMGRKLARALTKSTGETYKYDPKTERVVQSEQQAKSSVAAAASGAIDFREARKMRRVERVLDEELWDIFSALREVITNILVSEEGDKPGLLRKAFDDALKEIATLAEIELPEDNNMNADTRVSELEAKLKEAQEEIERLKAKLEQAMASAGDGAPDGSGGSPELEALRVANEKLAEEKGELEKRVAELAAKLNERIVAETNEARKAALKDVGVTKDEIVAKWMVSLGEDGKIEGRSEDEFNDFVATLREVVQASGGAGDGSQDHDDPVSQSKNIGNLPAGGASGGQKDAMGEFFQTVRARLIPSNGE